MGKKTQKGGIGGGGGGKKRGKRGTGPTSRQKAAPSKQPPPAEMPLVEEDDLTKTGHDMETHGFDELDLSHLLNFSESTIGEHSKVKSRRELKKEKAEKRKLEENTERDFEKAPRTASTWDERTPENTRLPVRVDDHIKELPVRKPVEAESMAGSLQPQQKITGTSDDDEDSDDEDSEGGEEEPQKAVSTVQQIAARLHHFKELIATTCITVEENPEANISQLKEIVELVACKEEGLLFAVRKLAISSLVSVFSDILPGYRLRDWSSEEDAGPLSKEVKKTREYEKAFLSVYQTFLKQLHGRIKEFQKLCTVHSKQAKKATARATANGTRHGKASSSSAVGTHSFLAKSSHNLTIDQEHLTYKEQKHMRRQASTALLAAKALCRLLVAAPHFNFRNNIMDTIAPLMTGHLGDELAYVSREAAQTLFREDTGFDASLAFAKAMSQIIKARSYLVAPEMIDVFRSAGLQEKHIRSKQREAAEKMKERHKNKYHGAKGKNEKVTRRRKKELKAEKKLSKELMDAEGKANEKQLAHNQTQLLKVIFAIYFRVLKHARESPLLPAVLEGLSHFARLIDVDVFYDLLKVLQELIATDDISIDVLIHALTTTFKLLTDETSTITMDSAQFLYKLFESMYEMVELRNHHLFVHVLACLHASLIRRKEISTERVGGLVKRILLLAVHIPPHGAVSALAFVRILLQRYPRVSLILGNELVSTGLFNEEATAPEHSNAMSTPAWEMSLMRQNHYHPLVRHFAAHLLLGSPLHGEFSLSLSHMKTKPHEFFAEMKPSAEAVCVMPGWRSVPKKPKKFKKSVSALSLEVVDDEPSVDFGAIMGVTEPYDFDGLAASDDEDAYEERLANRSSMKKGSEDGEDDDSVHVDGSDEDVDDDDANDEDGEDDDESDSDAGYRSGLNPRKRNKQGFNSNGPSGNSSVVDFNSSSHPASLSDGGQRKKPKSKKVFSTKKKKGSRPGFKKGAGRGAGRGGGRSGNSKRSGGACPTNSRKGCKSSGKRGRR